MKSKAKIIYYLYIYIIYIIYIISYIIAHASFAS